MPRRRLARTVMFRKIIQIEPVILKAAVCDGQRGKQSRSTNEDEGRTGKWNLERIRFDSNHRAVFPPIFILSAFILRARVTIIWDKGNAAVRT